MSVMEEYRDLVAIATHSLLCVSQLPYVVLFSLRLETDLRPGFPRRHHFVAMINGQHILVSAEMSQTGHGQVVRPPGSLFDVSGCWTATG